MENSSPEGIEGLPFAGFKDFAQCESVQMGKVNPRTGKRFTKEEADRVCGFLKKKTEKKNMKLSFRKSYRVLVNEKPYDRIVSKLLKNAHRIRVGYGLMDDKAEIAFLEFCACSWNKDSVKSFLQKHSKEILNYTSDLDELERVTGMEAKRKRLGMSPGEFYAVPREPPSTSALPIFDDSHVRNAMARFNQTQMSSEEKSAAKNKIISAAKKFKIEIGEFGNEDAGKKKLAIEFPISEELGREFKIPYEIKFVALKEGKFNGVYYSLEELKNCYQSLMGKDITIDHGKSVKDIIGKVTGVKLNEEMRQIEGIGEIMEEDIAKKVFHKLITGVSVEIYVNYDTKGKNGLTAKDGEFSAISLVRIPACNDCRIVNNEVIHEHKEILAGPIMTMTLPISDSTANSTATFTSSSVSSTSS